MTGLSKERVESFRALPETLRLELLAQIEQGATGISGRRLQRIVQILERHLFGGEAARAVYQNLKISERQFYADLQEGLRRLGSLLDCNRPRSARIAIENPRQVMISQARAAHQAGMSHRAIDMLRSLHAAPLEAGQAAEIVGLELDVRGDLMMRPISPHDTAPFVGAARERAEDSVTREDDRAILDGTDHWVRAYASCYDNDRKRFLREYEAMVALLQPRAFAGKRNAAIAFCHFTLAALALVDSVGLCLDGERAERALADIDSILCLQPDMPGEFLCALHARYASFFCGKPGFAHRFSEKRMHAYKLGMKHVSMRNVWFALGMEVMQSLALGETTHALACASALYQNASASESAECQQWARMYLARAYNAAGGFAEAQRLIPMPAAFPQRHSPTVVLPACETLLGLRRYRECFDLATPFADNVEGPYRAWALILRAKAAYCAGNDKKAAVDIRDAIATFDTTRGHSFYTICSAYRTAHLITQDKRYLDMLSAVETILEDAEPAAPLVGEERGLTARQRTIARLAAAGETNDGIARRLSISPRTVKNSFNAIYARLGIRARWQLAEALASTASR